MTLVCVYAGMTTAIRLTIRGDVANFFGVGITDAIITSEKAGSVVVELNVTVSNSLAKANALQKLQDEDVGWPAYGMQTCIPLHVSRMLLPASDAAPHPERQGGLCGRATLRSAWR